MLQIGPPIAITVKPRLDHDSIVGIGGSVQATLDGSCQCRTLVQTDGRKWPRTWLEGLHMSKLDENAPMQR